jgi:trk system potassium uptake protein TrkH
MRLRDIKLQPAQIIILGFIILIFFGSILLSLPFATRDGKPLHYLDALFTSTSAVCVTGLVVVDTGTAFSLFGQIVIILLIQAGGLGVMTVMSFAFLLIGKRITLSERMVIKETFNEFELSGLVKIILKVLKVTLAAELLGAVLLATRFIPAFGLDKGIYFSLFHAISAFCNAGFDLLGPVSEMYSSFKMFANDPVVVLTLSFLIVSGGLGFVVISQIASPTRIRKREGLSRYTKLVLAITTVLILLGFVAVFSFEQGNPNTFGKMSFGNKLLNGLFQAITPRTAGFATIDQNMLMPATKFIVILLMFIGASPAGTGGGIKTTTFAVVVLFLLASMRGKQDVTAMDRRVASETVRRALTITLLALLLVIAATLALVAIEGQRGNLYTFENIVFEVVSAFGTVGLSTGLTPTLSIASRIILILVMFVGRVGLMTLVVGLAVRSRKDNANIRYPEERFMVG